MSRDLKAKLLFAQGVGGLELDRCGEACAKAGGAGGGRGGGGGAQTRPGAGGGPKARAAVSPASGGSCA